MATRWGVAEVKEWATATAGLTPNTGAVLETNFINGGTLLFLDQAAVAELAGLDEAEAEALVSACVELAETESMVRVPELRRSASASLSPLPQDEEEDEAPPLHLIHSSNCSKLGGRHKTWRRRHFQLHSDNVLSYFKLDKIKLLGQIALADVTKLRKGWETNWDKIGAECPRDAIPETRVEMVVAPNGEEARTFRFYCETAEDAGVWQQSLARAIAAARQANPRMKTPFNPNFRKTFVKQLVPRHLGWVTKNGGRVKNWKRRYLVLAQNYTVHYWKDDRCLGAPIGSIQLKYVTEIVVGGDCRWELGVPDEATSDLRFALRTDVRDYLVFADTAMEASAWVTAIKTAWKECQAKSRSVNMNAGGYGAIAKTNEEYQLLQAIASEAVHDDALADEDEDNDADDSGAAEPMGDDVDDDEDSIFLDRYLDMYNLPHTNERRQIFRHAIQIGRRVGKTSQRQRHVTIVYNPVSGAGKAKKNVDLTLAPVLDIAKVAYMVIATTHRGHAREIARTLDYSKTDGIVVAGGDGLVSEVVSGLMDRNDGCMASGFPVGLVPSGTANAMANELDFFESESYVELIGATSLMVAEGRTRKVDVLEMKAAPTTGPDGETLSEGRSVAGLSCIGWGLAGAVASKADQLRWLPGQRQFRYDIAGFVTLMKNWPLHCEADFEFLEEDEANPGEYVWRKEHLNMLNMIATNCHRLGVDHPIHPTTEIDNGWLDVVFLGGGHTRSEAARAGLYMKGGKFLSTHKAMSSRRVKELKMTPTCESEVPILIDGDPWDVAPIHVKVIHQGLNVYCKEKRWKKLKQKPTDPEEDRELVQIEAAPVWDESSNDAPPEEGAGSRGEDDGAGTPPPGDTADEVAHIDIGLSSLADDEVDGQSETAGSSEA